METEKKKPSRRAFIRKWRGRCEPDDHEDYDYYDAEECGSYEEECSAEPDE